MKRDRTNASAARKATVGRADLLWLLHTLGQAEAAACAALTGFRWCPEGEQPPPPPKLPPPRPRPPPPPPETQRKPLRATHFAVLWHRNVSESESAEDPDIDPSGPIFDDLDTGTEALPPAVALSPRARLAAFLRQVLRLPQVSRVPDIGRLLQDLSRLSLPRQVPRQRRHCWSAEAALVIDLSLAASPINDDLVDLAEQAHTLSAGRLQVFCRLPGRGWLVRGDGAGARWLAAREQALQTASHWLLAGDLGSLRMDDVGRRAWQGRIRAHVAAGGRVTLLTGAGDDAFEPLPRRVRWALWEHGRRLSPRSVARTTGRVGTPAGLDRLLAASSLAVRVEPALLRDIRLALGLTIGCELAAWNHPDVERCPLGMQIRADRLSHHRDAARNLPLVERQQIATLVRLRHAGISPLIRMEEAALAVDLADADPQAAAEAWVTAVRTLRQAEDSRAGRDLAGFLGRAGCRAHPSLWRSVPSLADAYVLACRRELRAGAVVPAGLPVSCLNRHLAGPTGPDGARPGGDRALWIVQRGAGLWALGCSPAEGEIVLLAGPPAEGYELESPQKARQWLATPDESAVIEPRAAGLGPWTIRTPSVEAAIAEIPRPSWALEWGRDRQGLYALAPSPLGDTVRLYWSGREGPGEAADWPPGPRAFRCEPLRLGETMTLGADLAYGLYLDAVISGVVQRFRWIETGEFWMGSPEDESERRDNEGPRHRVRLTQGFWLAETACTQSLWQAVMGQNPSRFKDDPENPVENVSWDDVQGFLGRVTAQLPGVRAELPSEAQWEYACRAGTETAFSFGDAIDPLRANYDGNYAYADGPTGEYRERTVPVKRFEPNAWGLYQMHGNVWEWCADGHRNYDGRPQVDPRGPEGAERVVRGGSWSDRPGWLRAAYRGRWPRVLRLGLQGFRFSLRSMAPEGGAERPPEAGADPEGPREGGGAPGRRPAAAKKAKPARRKTPPPRER